MAEPSDAPDEPGGEKRTSTKPLLSARDTRSGGSNNGCAAVCEDGHGTQNEARSARSGPASKPMGPSPSPRPERPSRKPVPVRAMARSEAPPSPSEPDAEEVELTVDGVDWVARVLGRSGGSRVGATPLLLVGFWPVESPSGTCQREALVVARTLSGVSTEVLGGACEGARSVPPSND
jgi:hypothetical protein